MMYISIPKWIGIACEFQLSDFVTISFQINSAFVAERAASNSNNPNIGRSVDFIISINQLITTLHQIHNFNTTFTRCQNTSYEPPEYNMNKLVELKYFDYYQSHI